MKARIRGTNDSFKEITGIEIDYAIYDPEVIELADSNVQVGGNKIAQIAVAYADGLIKQLKKKKK